MAASTKQSDNFVSDGIVDFPEPYLETRAELNLMQATAREQEMFLLAEKEQVATKEVAATQAVQQAPEVEKQPKEAPKVEQQTPKTQPSVFQQEEPQTDDVQVIAIEDFLQLVDEAEKAKALDEAELVFTLTRVDIFDYLSDLEYSDKLSVSSSVKLKSKTCLFDRLFCGDICFGLLMERSSVIKLVLLMDDQFAQTKQTQHKLFRVVKNEHVGSWHSIIIDGSFSQKQQVFDLVKYSFDFVVENYILPLSQQTDEVRQNVVKNRNDDIEQFAVSHAIAPDSDFVFAIAQREIALERYKFANPPQFEFDIEGILNYIKKSKNFNQDTQIVEREKPSQPIILKVDSKSFALIYVKKPSPGRTHQNIIIRARLSDEIAERYNALHPRMSRIRYLKSRNWHVIPIDGSFASPQEIYQLLLNSKSFVIQEKE